MSLAKKLAIGSIVGGLLAYLLVYKTVFLRGGSESGIPHYGAELIEAHLTLILIGAAAYIVLKGAKNARGRKIAFGVAVAALLFQIIPMYDFSKMG
ncbi:MAG: hypothetical protein P8J20_05580 [Novosphingobium sp.]|nr:hypothetical protein [Novosphingobium sp.]